MDQHRSPSVFRRPVVGLVLLAAVALVVGLVAWPADTTSEPTAQPDTSYASLQDLLRDGRGKGFDKGMLDVWASISPTPDVPTAWVWVLDDTTDGNGVEIWAYHPNFAHPVGEEAHNHARCDADEHRCNENQRTGEGLHPDAGVGEVGVDKAGAGEVGGTQVGAREVGAIELRSFERPAAEILPVVVVVGCQPLLP